MREEELRDRKREEKLGREVRDVVVMGDGCGRETISERVVYSEMITLS